ncbi:hypothetical protein ILUMI_22666 [Ignelater luminosus]|uniref:non-specific serine/threonine protein kinase n=1 Tax=Ignelater luminosus TaxID=2038154 RepID=A0A8K0CA70_IGNLU|nr:hypothetical protein ILUMI_22666 [Ignelater luminosus]
MRKRSNHEPAFDEPPVKRTLTVPSSTVNVTSGMILTDILGEKWRLGKSVGKGGFGMIYLASDNINQDVDSEAQYVAKVEAHKSGPLFVERNCYLLIAKPEMIEEWKNKNGLKHLGMPHYVASGSHNTAESKYRFLIIPRFNKDLDEMFEAKKCKFNLKTVLTIALQTIDVLQYIHSKGYVHSDIKASNILLEMKKTKTKVVYQSVKNKAFRYYGCTPVRSCKVRKLSVCRTLRPNMNLRYLRNDDVLEEAALNSQQRDIDKIYLLDYGLACKYVTQQGEHKKFCSDKRKAHAGTILFCSRDAHEGAQSRRSDLECLGYNLIYWLTSQLPWSGDTENPEVVQKKKTKCIDHLKEFLDYSFGYQCPRFLFDYFNYLKSLTFEKEPDYKYCKYLFKHALKEYGYKDNLLLDFENLEGWGRKQKKFKRNSENYKVQRSLLKLKRSPLKSNLPIKFSQPIKPVLRRKTNKKLKHKLKWSKILDPEHIIKQANARERKMTDTSDTVNFGPSLTSIEDLQQLNPTTAMREIFNRCIERQNNGNGISPRYRNEGALVNIEGYTPAMMEVYNRKKEREEMEFEQLFYQNSKLRSTRSNNNNKSNNKIKKPQSRVKKQKQVIINSPPCTRLKKKLKSTSYKKVEIPKAPTRVYSLRG